MAALSAAAGGNGEPTVNPEIFPPTPSPTQVMRNMPCLVSHLGGLERKTHLIHSAWFLLARGWPQVTLVCSSVYITEKKKKFKFLPEGEPTHLPFDSCQTHQVATSCCPVENEEGMWIVKKILQSIALHAF